MKKKYDFMKLRIIFNKFFVSCSVDYYCNAGTLKDKGYSTGLKQETRSIAAKK